MTDYVASGGNRQGVAAVDQETEGVLAQGGLLEARRDRLRTEDHRRVAKEVASNIDEHLLPPAKRLTLGFEQSRPPLPPSRLVSRRGRQ